FGTMEASCYRQTGTPASPMHTVTTGPCWGSADTSAVIWRLFSFRYSIFLSSVRWLLDQPACGLRNAGTSRWIGDGARVRRLSTASSISAMAFGNFAAHLSLQCSQYASSISQ